MDITWHLHQPSSWDLGTNMISVIPSGHHRSSHGSSDPALKASTHQVCAALWTDEEGESSRDQVELQNVCPWRPSRYSNARRRDKSINEEELKGERAELKIQWQRKWHKWSQDNRAHKRTGGKRMGSLWYGLFCLGRGSFLKELHQARQEPSSLGTSNSDHHSVLLKDNTPPTGQERTPDPRCPISAP